MSVFSRNISAKLARNASFLALALGALFSVPGVLEECRRERALAAQTLSRGVVDLAPSAARAALSGDQGFGGEIAASLMRSLPVRLVEIRDAGEAVIARREAPEPGWLAGLGLALFGAPEETVPLFQREGGSPVGALRVVGNGAWLVSGVWEPLLWALLRSALFAVFMSALFFALLRKKLAGPLREAALAIDALAQEGGGNRQFLASKTAVGHEEDEIGAVVQAAGALAAAAARNMERRETALREAQASSVKLQTMIDASSDLIFLKDADFRYVVANKAHEAAFGLPVDQILGKTDFDLMPNNAALNCFKSDRTTLERGSVDIDECMDGGYYHVVKERVEDGQGRGIGVAGVIRDVTESRKLEKMRREKQASDAANKAARGFVAEMSHEIRTPLSSLLGAVELLSDSGLTPAQRELAARMEFSGGRLMEIVSDVLDLSAIEGARFPVEIRAFDLDELMGGIVRSFEDRIMAGDFALTVATAGTMRKRRMGDPLRLRRALVNLVGETASRAGGGRIALRSAAGAGPDLVVFSITNETLQASQTSGDAGASDAWADPPGLRGFGESGLGLSIARKLIEGMDGEIRFTGELGSGSEFSVILPLPEAPDASVESVSPGTVLDAPAAAQPAERASARKRPSLAGLRLLIVEDFPPNRAILESFLEEADVVPDVAEDGREAVVKYARKPYDLVFMDIEMPEMDGYEATRRIRDFERDNGVAPVPVIALTAHAFAHNKARCLEAGCTEFHAKPIRKSRFLEILGKYAPADLERRTRETGASGADAQRIVKPGLEKLLPIFIESVNRYLGQAEEALVTGNYEEIRRIGHTLKGSAGSYGAEDLWDMALNLEHAGSVGDAPSARNCLASMRGFMETHGLAGRF